MTNLTAPRPRAAIAHDSMTPLLDLPALAARCDVGRVLVKDESRRELGNFKSLGGTSAGLRALARADDRVARRLICASDGNHGLAVALAARRADAAATIYLHRGVPDRRAERIRRLGAEIAWIAGTYDDAVDHAAAAAARGDGILIADTSDDAADPVVGDVMRGYARIADEMKIQLGHGLTPTHLFVQAGVGGLAAALADGLADHAIVPRIVVVEPSVADCVGRALTDGRAARIAGELRTVADMLACGVASVPAVATLRRHRAAAIVADEAQLAAAPEILRAAGGPITTPSGAAGLAGLCALDARRRSEIGLDHRAVVALIVTEGNGSDDAADQRDT